jgi:hypothetical protein
MAHWGSALTGTLALAVSATPVAADITPRSVELLMTATVREASGGGLVRGAGDDAAPATRSFSLAELPDFPLLPGASLILGWFVSGDGLGEFIDEEGELLCQPFQFSGVSTGPARTACSNAESAATLLSAPLPFEDRLPDQPVAQGPNVYLGDYSVDLIYIPSAFWSPKCCAYLYDSEADAFARLDAPGLFRLTGQPHSATGGFIGRSGWLDYRFEISGTDDDEIAGEGRALIQFDVTWRYRNYETTGLPAPAGVALFGLGLAALAGRRARA